jgi:aminoglycoside phosphotransferase (APT) family kinase protein
MINADVEALRRYFEREVPGFGGELAIELIHGGRSNLTYAVTDGTHRWVLRRPPLGPLTPTAHDVGREFRVMAALGPTDVPVPARSSPAKTRPCSERPSPSCRMWTDRCCATARPCRRSTSAGTRRRSSTSW